jgi:GTP cyclohydrolase I
MGKKEDVSAGVEFATAELLTILGVDLDDENYRETPARF